MARCASSSALVSSLAFRRSSDFSVCYYFIETILCDDAIAWK